MSKQRMRADSIAGLVSLSLVAIGCFVVLRPFLAAILWALILAISTWPAYRWFLGALKGRRTLAAGLMTLLLATALLLPFVIMGASLADDVAGLAAKVREVMAEGPPPPPSWLAKIPLLGERLTAYWQGVAQGGLSVADGLTRYLGPIKDWLVAAGANLGEGVLDLSLSLVTAFFLYRDGEAGAHNLQTVVVRLAGERGQRLLDVTEGTMKGVVYGILGTALAQGMLAGLGLWLAGVPGALFLGVVIAFLSVIPLGPPLVWLPAGLWLIYTGELAWGIFIFVWGAVVISSVDNFLKPYFISRGSNLPLLLVVLGVFGGIVAFGFLGIFLGPTLLAVGYTLLREWSHGSAGPVSEAPP